MITEKNRDVYKRQGETRLDVYFDAITKEIILRNSDNQNNKESKTKNKVRCV